MSNALLLRSLREDFLQAYGMACVFNMLDRNDNTPEMIDAIKDTGVLLQNTLQNAIRSINQLAKES